MPNDSHSGRQGPRVEVRREAILIDSGGVPIEVTMLDISSGGFRLECKVAPKTGELVRLRVERGEEFPAQIKWTPGNEAGGVFLDPISSERWK